MPKNVGPITHTSITADLVRKSKRHTRPSASGPAGLAEFYASGLGITATAGFSTHQVNSGWSLTDEYGTTGASVVSGDVQYTPGIYSVMAFFLFASASATPRELELSEQMVGSTLVTWYGSDWQIQVSGTYYTTAVTSSNFLFRFLTGTGTITLDEAGLVVTRLGDLPA